MRSAKASAIPVRERLHQDGAVIVVRPLEAFRDPGFLDPGRHHEAPDIVPGPALGRSHEVREADVRPPVATLKLLAQAVKGGERSLRLSPV
jgi:hypothetical protein